MNVHHSPNDPQSGTVALRAALYSTSMQRVAGLGNMAGSQKAADLFMKSRFILERTGGNNVVFLSGTPVSNTMAEMYTVQRYLDEGALRAMGVSHFDAWARVFGEVVTDWELSECATRLASPWPVSTRGRGDRAARHPCSGAEASYGWPVSAKPASPHRDRQIRTKVSMQGCLGEQP